ncbi:MAG: AIR synthase [Candidatus Eisenbacteria bacterium]|uniref:AIR synthase n=1 Tax=Eiseniibacteriota bacterium TaxID=2212470 RepID=A0A849T233_UNCEI|nr:AIR synthase [Candidatus Eisenbacteria bacterium]
MTSWSGKVSPAVFETLIAPHLGATRPEVVVGPRSGHDCAIVKVGAGRVMAVTTDPLSWIPCLGLERSARLACHLLASDLWTSGLAPNYAAIEFNLPAELDDEAFGRYWRAMSDEWKRLQVAVVTGHTGRYGAGGETTLIGGATLIGVGDEGRYLTPAMAKSGDRVIVTKGCAIEATAIAAHLVPERMRERFAEASRVHADALPARVEASPAQVEASLARAAAFVDQVSVVADCQALLRVGVRERGISALHDATEGGVLGGLIELAHACGNDLRVDQSRIPVALEARVACEALGGLDPYWTLSEGALIACVTPLRLTEALAELRSAGIVAAEIGEVIAGTGRVWLTTLDGRIEPLDTPRPDPYWAAYAKFAARTER